MRTSPNGWDALVASGKYKYDFKLALNGVDYDASNLYSISVSGSAVGDNAPCVGGAVASEIDVEMKKPIASIPRQATVIPSIRLVSTTDPTVTSGWLNKGTYYIDSRTIDDKKGTLTIHGYDAMIKADTEYLPAITERAQTAYEACSEIASLIGVTLDSGTATILNRYEYYVPYYAGQYTIRETLSYIAAAYGGAFIIAEDNALRLVRLFITGTSINLLDKATNYEFSNAPASFDKVVIVVDETHEYVSGTGDNVLEFDCPFGTQEIADDLLASFVNYQYKPYEVIGAVVSPLYELGDSLQVKGITYQILNREMDFNQLMSSHIHADYDDEVDHEFVYVPAEERRIERLRENVSSEFSIMASEISSKVSQTDYTGNEIVSRINQTSTTIDVEADKINFDGKAITMNSSSLTVNAVGAETNAIKLGYGNYYTSHTSTCFRIVSNDIVRGYFGKLTFNDREGTGLRITDTNGASRFSLTENYVGANYTAMQVRDNNENIRFDMYTAPTNNVAEFNIRDESANKRVRIQTSTNSGGGQILLYQTNNAAGNYISSTFYNLCNTSGYVRYSTQMQSNGGVLTLYYNSSGEQTVSLNGATGYCQAGNFHSTSDIRKKTDIEDFKGGLGKILMTDIASYRLIDEKKENENCKKHIGAVIGGDFTIADEIVSENGTHVDLYSMISVAWQAIKEQQAEIEELKAEIKELKGAKK